MIKERVKNILQKGIESENDTFDEFTAIDAIETLKKSAAYHPDFLLQQMALLCSEEMMGIAAAMLFTQAPNSFLMRNDVKINIKECLMHQNPEQLMILVEMLKDKSLNKGLGSRPQKIIKSIMETWNCHVLNDFLVNFPKEMFNLINLIHPKYVGKRGELASEFLYSMH